MAERHMGRQAVVTLRTVAERAGVSTMTVSNVINNTGKVGDTTRVRVREAIAQTGYVPNIEARRLAGAAGTRIGLIYPDSRTPFLTEVLLVALDAACQRGSQLIVRDAAGTARADAEALVTHAIAGGAEALLLLPPFAELLADSPAFARLGMPAVAFAAAGPLHGMQTVRIDNRAAAEALTLHLIELGHRDIGFIAGPAGHGDSQERLQGFRAAMRRAKLTVKTGRVSDGDFTFQSGCEAADRLLSARRRPTAVIACNDDMAAGVQWGAQRAGLCLPRDLSVAGFDDTPAARRMWPPLTVIRQPLAEMAHAAIDLLIQALTARDPPAQRDVVHPHVLITRESTSRFSD